MTTAQTLGAKQRTKTYLIHMTPFSPYNIIEMNYYELLLSNFAKEETKA